MAKFQLQTPFKAISGKVGGNDGVVGFKTRTQNVFRRMVIPNNPDTAAQQAVRQAFTLASQAYSSLNDAQIAAWENLADALVREDSLDQPYKFFGNNAFLSVNMYRLLDGLAIENVAPFFFVAPAISIDSIGSLGADIQINVSDFATTDKVALRFSRPLSGAARGRETDVSFITNDPADSIVTSDSSSIVITPDRWSLSTGDRVAISAQSLSSEYLFGQRRFVSSIVIQ